MVTTTLDQAVLEQFRPGFSGELVGPADPGYEEVRSVFNAMVDKRPALIARCRSVGDVVAAVNLAREKGRELAVRSGGHSVAGMSSTDGGVVIDLRPMNDILIDPAMRVARVGAGATWGGFDAGAQEFGLATTGGRISTTGVSGLTLGGGSGWLERKHGLACDNLLRAEVVIADGQVVTASEETNPDLFWALHGGGGNFGVVTCLDFRLHSVGPTVLAGLLLWPGAAGRDVLRFHRDVVERAPDELGSAIGFITGPPFEFIPRHLQGASCCVVALCYTGPVEEGKEVVKALRSFGPPDADLVQTMPYTAFQSIFDDANRPGLRHYWTTDHLGHLDDDAVDAFVDHATRMSSPRSECFLFPWGGAVARAAGGETPLAQRNAPWVTHALLKWEQPGQDTEHIGWGRAFTAAMKRFGSGGVYLNFIGDEGQDRIRAAYGDHYARLVEIKARYDPHNLFRLNQNLKP